MQKTLKEIRAKKRITLADIPIEASTVSRIETGQRELTLNTAKVLAKAYGVTIDVIVKADAAIR